MRRNGVRLKRGFSNAENTFVGEMDMCHVMHGNEMIPSAHLSSLAKGKILTLYQPALINIRDGFTLRGIERVGDAGLVQEWVCELLSEEEIKAFKATEPSAMGGAHNWASTKF